MKKKIAILHAQVPFVTGGAELMVNSLKANLISRGFEAEIIALPFKWYPENSLYDNMLAWRLLDLSESNGQKIDLVIGTKFPSYGAIHDNKVIWMIQQYRQVYDLYDSQYGVGNDINGKQIRERVSDYDKITIQEAKSVYTISKNVSNRLKRYNGIDSEPLYQPPPMYGKYKTGDSGDYICSVGRLDKLKRNDLLIESLVHCDKNVKLKIAGKGPEMENLISLARKLKVEDRVEFLGFVPDGELIDLYANSRAVYFAPVDEDYGYITLEAFLSKKPVITCNDSGGVLEFVEDGHSGFVVEPNAESLASSINKIWFDKKKSIDMGLSGYEIVKDINWDNVIKKLTCLL